MLFVALTILFASISAYQFGVSPSSGRVSTQTLYTTVTLSTIAPKVPVGGNVVFPDTGRFAYERIDTFGEGQSVTFGNVTFVAFH